MDGELLEKAKSSYEAVSEQNFFAIPWLALEVRPRHEDDGSHAD